MLKPQWQNKKRENLVVLAVLFATLLAVFLASGKGQEFLNGVGERLWGSAIIRWEKSPDRKPANTETLNPASWRDAEDTEKEILALIKDLQGTYGVYFEDLETGANFGINEDKIFTAASLIKLPVFIAVYQEVEKGIFSLSTKYYILNTDKIPGAGSMYYAPVGTVYTYEKMLELMGKQSDNTAQNVLVKLVGEKKIQQVIDELGMRRTSFAKNETTSVDVGRFFRGVYQGNLVNRENRERIYDHLTDTIWEDRIPAGIPDGVRVVHKVGIYIGIYSDAGIVFGERPFILVIMNEGIKEAEAKEVLPKIAEMVWGIWGI